MHSTLPQESHVNFAYPAPSSKNLNTSTPSPDSHSFTSCSAPQKQPHLLPPPTPHPLLISPPRLNPIPLRLPLPIPCLQDAPPHNHDIAPLLQHHQPRRPILLAQPIPHHPFPHTTYRLAALIVISRRRRQRHARRKRDEVIARLGIQTPLRDETQDEIAILARELDAAARVRARQQVAFGAHFGEEEQASRDGRFGQFDGHLPLLACSRPTFRSLLVAAFIPVVVLLVVMVVRHAPRDDQWRLLHRPLRVLAYCRGRHDAAFAARAAVLVRAIFAFVRVVGVVGVVVAVGGGAWRAGRDLGRDALVEGDEGCGGGFFEGRDDGGAREDVCVYERRPGRDAVIAGGVLFLDGAWFGMWSASFLWCSEGRS